MIDMSIASNLWLPFLTLLCVSATKKQSSMVQSVFVWPLSLVAVEVCLSALDEVQRQGSVTDALRNACHLPLLQLPPTSNKFLLHS